MYFISCICYKDMYGQMENKDDTLKPIQMASKMASQGRPVKHKQGANIFPLNQKTKSTTQVVSESTAIK